MRNIITSLLLLFVVMGSYAQQAPLSVSIEHDLDENSGDTFEVDIFVSDFTDLYTFQLFLTWDDNLFRINEGTFYNPDLPFFNESNIVLPQDDASIPDPGKVRIVWGDAAARSLPDESLLVTLSFTILGQPCDEAPFTFNDIGTEESEILLASILNNATGNFENIGVSFDATNVQIPGVGCTSSTYEEAALVDVSVYPNPAIDVITVSYEDEQLKGDTQFIIMTSMGQKQSHTLNTQKETSIDISDLSAGSYLYQVITDGRPVARGQFSKVE